MLNILVAILIYLSGIGFSYSSYDEKSSDSGDANVELHVGEDVSGW